MFLIRYQLCHILNEKRLILAFTICKLNCNQSCLIQSIKFTTNSNDEKIEQKTVMKMKIHTSNMNNSMLILILLIYFIMRAFYFVLFEMLWWKPNKTKANTNKSNTLHVRCDDVEYVRITVFIVNRANNCETIDVTTTTLSHNYIYIYGISKPINNDSIENQIKIKMKTTTCIQIKAIIFILWFKIRRVKNGTKRNEQKKNCQRIWRSSKRTNNNNAQAKRRKKRREERLQLSNCKLWHSSD